MEGEYREREGQSALAPKFGGVINVSMGMNITEVGGMIPDAMHTESEEVLFLISGRAKLVIEGEGSGKLAGTAFFQSEKHRVENIGDEPLKLVWIYCPCFKSHAIINIKKRRLRDV